MPVTAAQFGQSADHVTDMAAQQQARARAASSNPWAQQSSNPDGSVSQQFSGPLGGANQNLMAEALRNMGQPMDFSQYNFGTGDDYRAQAQGNMKSQMGDWLGGMTDDLGGQSRQRLQDQGFAEGSSQYDAALGKEMGWQGDMQSTLDNAAIGLSGQGGQMLQGIDANTKGQQMAEALRMREYPLEQLGQMQGLAEGSGPRAVDDFAFEGARMDAGQKYNDYWGARGREKAEDDAMWDSILGIGGAAVSMIPVAGPLLAGGGKAAVNATRRSI